MVHSVFITGASGLLGRAILKKFQNEGWNTFGCAFSRTGPNLHKVDITNTEDVQNAISKFKSDIVIHCAALRFPDKVDADPQGAEKLNVHATQELANILAPLSIPVVYISTDYVFDGKSPPFSVDDKPNPLNLYGRTKLQGEEVVLSASTDNIVLRIPVIYGPVEHLSESAVTVLFDTLLDTSKQKSVSNYERRNPSHVDDIALICFDLATKKLEDKNISGIFQWCGKEVFTKYEMVLQMAQVFSLPHSHITAVTDTSGTSSAVRPFDTRMDTSRLESLGIGQHTPFTTGIYSALFSWVSKSVN